MGATTENVRFVTHGRFVIEMMTTKGSNMTPDSIHTKAFFFPSKISKL